MVINKNIHSTPFARQDGAALLALVLVIVIGSSFYMLSKLNTNIAKTQQDEQTGIALRSAKNALIGYAVSYPDKVNPDEGPGYLPCPDNTNDGIALGNCSDGGFTTIGRFPYKTLETEELLDGNGQRLWYVLSENFRYGANKTVPLNSESPTSAGLSVNGVGDIVAVLFAPGEPFDNQDRAAGVNDVTNYLEDDNSDLDTSFVTAINANINDRLIVITRQELMQAVEKRVLGEVSMMLTNYFNFIDTDNDGDAAYPWLAPFADPKASKAPLQGEHNGGDNSADLIDTSRDFTEWGVAIGDTVRNFTDGSIGMVNTVTPTTLTVAGPFLGTDNDYDVDDEYYIYPAELSEKLTGTATNANDSASLEDTNNDFTELDITTGDIVDNLDDGSSGVVNLVTTNQLTFFSLTGGTDNDFDTGDSYRLRSQQGQATAGSSGLTLLDTNNDFTVMGIQVGDLISNMTDGSMGRISAVTTNTLSIDELYFGTNNIFTAGDYYSLPRFNTNNSAREGLLSFHEVGEAFKTALVFDWTITAAVGDISVTNSAILQNYLQSYAALASESFDNSIGTCIWLLADIADCYGSFRSFINISGNLTSGIDTPVITDTNAQFITDGVKRGDIAVDYDDETLEISGTVDAANSGTAVAGSSNLTLIDTNNNFIDISVAIGETIFNTTDNSSGTIQTVSANQITVDALSGGTDDVFAPGDTYRIGDVSIFYDASEDFSVYERYSYVIQNDTLELELGAPKIQGVISDVINATTLKVQSYLGESLTPIQFRPGDNYAIHKPNRAVVETVTSETQLTTDNYTSSLDPDFDYFPGPVLNAEYYRIIPAGKAYTGTVTSVDSIGAIDTFTDTTADFITEGIAVGDVVETNVGIITLFGEITAITPTSITTTLYGGGAENFILGNAYTVYHAYVFSREHVIHARFRGNQTNKILSEQRVRDVCLGYSADCTTLSAAINFSGNGGTPLISVTDYEEDEITEAGRATFTPTAASSGNIRVSNIDYYLSEATGEIPDWFITNKWHQLIQIAYSVGDSPNGGAVCTTGTDCITLTNDGLPTNNKRALIVSAGSTLAGQDRTSGIIGSYFENENGDQVIDPVDDNFQTGAITATFNDQIRILDTSP